MVGKYFFLSVFFMSLGFISPVIAVGYLDAVSFPETIEDAGFVERIEAATMGYTPWDTKYDADGKCIENCSYYSLSLKDEMNKIETATQNAMYAANNYQYQQYQMQQYQMQQNQTRPEYYGRGSIGRSCPVFNPYLTLDSDIPNGNPVIMGDGVRISSKFGLRTAPKSGASTLHRGVDIAAPTGTPVYAPANGVVMAAWSDNSCGNGLKIKHAEDFETVYCHLSKNDFYQSGQSVQSGCVVGQIGSTGVSTGPHLHYGVIHRDEYINPENYF